MNFANLIDNSFFFLNIELIEKILDDYLL